MQSGKEMLRNKFVEINRVLSVFKLFDDREYYGLATKVLPIVPAEQALIELIVKKTEVFI